MVFKKSRIKIVAAIMSGLVLLWVTTLGVIYASSYFEMSKQNKSMLRTHAQMYVLPQAMNEFQPVKPHGSRPDFDPDSPKFQLSTFYSVAVAYDGEVLQITNEPPTVHTDDGLKKLAQHIISDDKTNGTINNLTFYKVDKGGYILVAFMDNTVVNESAITLLRNTLVFGAAALIVFFFLSVFLARKIVNPLEQSYQKQKQFVSDAGHELKTPISVIGANAELLARELGDNSWLANIQYENERMGVLVGQLLSLARTENVTLQMERIDLGHLVVGESLPFESVAFEKGLTLCSNIASNIAVMGNSAQLKQIVSILLDNAICHAKDGKVYITLSKAHGFANLSVVNSGDEIPINQRDRIFERFYRIDAARNSKDGHYGLGLAIAKAIVTSHKGRIDVLCYDGFVEFRVQLPAL